MHNPPYKLQLQQQQQQHHHRPFSNISVVSSLLRSRFISLRRAPFARTAFADSETRVGRTGRYVRAESHGTLIVTRPSANIWRARQLSILSLRVRQLGMLSGRPVFVMSTTTTTTTVLLIKCSTCAFPSSLFD